MEWPSFRKQRLYLFAVSIVLLAAPPTHSAENMTNARIISFSGNPVIIPAGRAPLPVKRQTALLPDMRIQTGPRDSVEIQFSGEKGCRILLGPNSVLEFKEAKTPGDYRASLRKGTLSCQAAPCWVTLDLETSVGRLRGRNSKFSVRVRKETTIVFLRSGDLRLFLGGQSIPLRQMTRITISHSGSHRIASIEETQPGTLPFTPPMAFQNNDLPPSGISPVSATKRP